MCIIKIYKRIIWLSVIQIQIVMSNPSRGSDNSSQPPKTGLGPMQSAMMHLHRAQFLRGDLCDSSLKQGQEEYHNYLNLKINDFVAEVDSLVVVVAANAR